MATIPVKYSEVVLQPDLLKNNLIDKEVYVKELVYDGLRSMQVNNPNNDEPLPAFGLHFSGTDTNDQVFGLSTVFSIRNIEEIKKTFGVEVLYQFYQTELIDNVLVLSDLVKTEEFITSSNLFKSKKDPNYPFYMFVSNSKGGVDKLFFTRKQVLLMDYIKTYFNNGMVPARAYNSSILEIPDDIRNVDVLFESGTKIEVLGIYYETIKEKTQALYRVFFNITGIDGLFIFDLIGKPTTKNKLKKKIIYTDFEKMFAELVDGKYEDNTYIFDIGHSCTHSYKKSLRGTVIDKKIFIYADKIHNVTDTFTFYKEQFDYVIEAIQNSISDNIGKDLVVL